MEQANPLQLLGVRDQLSAGRRLAGRLALPYLEGNRQTCYGGFFGSMLAADPVCADPGRLPFCGWIAARWALSDTQLKAFFIPERPT